MAVYKTFRTIKLRKKDEYGFLMIMNLESSDLQQLKEDAVAFEQKLLDDEVGSCKILIDRLLIKRSPELRFLEGSFDGEELNLNDIRFVTIAPNHCVREHTSKLLVKNKKMLETSILKKSQKRQILKGVIL